MSNISNHHFGTVAEFDHHRGLGVVESEDITVWDESKLL